MEEGMETRIQQTEKEEENLVVLKAEIIILKIMRTKSMVTIGVTTIMEDGGVLRIMEAEIIKVEMMEDKEVTMEITVIMEEKETLVVLLEEIITMKMMSRDTTTGEITVTMEEERDLVILVAETTMKRMMMSKMAEEITDIKAEITVTTHSAALSRVISSLQAK